MRSQIVRVLKLLGIFPFIKKVKLWTNPKTRGMMLHYSEFIKKGDLCFDIGANMGGRSEIFLGLGARVVALEPQPACVAFLQKTFKGSPFTIVPKAVGSKEGVGTLSLCDNTSVVATMSSRWKTEGRFSGEFTWTKTETVPMTTLDLLIKEYGAPAFCKIDVEGFEEEVMKGLSQKIPCLSFEFTREFSDTSNRIVEYLSTLGSARFNYSVGESHALKLKSWVSKQELLFKMGEEKNPDLWGDVYVRMG